MAESSYRCPSCNTSVSVKPRNLAVFIDGTSNMPGPQKTNVLKLNDIVSTEERPELEQRAKYFEGIGVHDVDDLPLSMLTYLPKVIYGACETAFGWTVDKNVKGAYKWLAEKYREGDRIYLFGFSRGAYQVRALAGMIHEVGLVREVSKKAYRLYLSFDPRKLKTNRAAVDFKKSFCWSSVRIHFMGVWDTVSSLGSIVHKAHITASTSLNPCHFRHALALDDRRVKFLPEYFTEVNAHYGNIKNPRYIAKDPDAKEVWFAGYHSDVGGTSRSHTERGPDLDDEHFPVHAGNIPLLWMRREAVDAGLAFNLDDFPWWPEDVDFGTVDSMNVFWRIFEVLRVRHQVSFSGTGKHELRKHGFRPRQVIPGQWIHYSVSPDNVYMPSATLAYGVEIPVIPQSGPGALWPAELVTEEATTHLLSSLLSDQQNTLKSLGEVFLLLNLRLDMKYTQTIPIPEWLRAPIREAGELDKFALTVIYDAISNFSTSEELVNDAKDTLSTILSSPDRLDFSRVLYVLHFTPRRKPLRRFITDDMVIRALDEISKRPSMNLFPLVMDSLRYLIDDEHHRTNVINQLIPPQDGNEAGNARLLRALEAKAPSHLVASLKLFASVVPHQTDRNEMLQSRIINLAARRGPAGSAAVEALLASKEPGPYNIHFSNLLSYLSKTLLPLDAEVGGAWTSIPIDLPLVLKGTGSQGLDEKTIDKLLSTIQSWNARQRITSTLTLLKLCSNQIVRDYCSQKGVLDVFVKQLKNKKTALLAAYALRTCLRHNEMWEPQRDYFSRVARLVINMVDKNWFDDAVGRVEGAKIFRGLMDNDGLLQNVIDMGIVAHLMKKLNTGNSHETRMSLRCLEIIWTKSPAGLAGAVTNSLTLLMNEDVEKRKRGIKTLSSLAQTEAGEQAIKPRVNEIVTMLLPSGNTAPPRHQLFSSAAALFDLCKNETLREHIQQTDGYESFKALRRNSILYPQT